MSGLRETSLGVLVILEELSGSAVDGWVGWSEVLAANKGRVAWSGQGRSRKGRLTKAVEVLLSISDLVEFRLAGDGGLEVRRRREAPGPAVETAVVPDESVWTRKPSGDRGDTHSKETRLAKLEFLAEKAGVPPERLCRRDDAEAAVEEMVRKVSGASRLFGHAALFERILGRRAGTEFQKKSADLIELKKLSRTAVEISAECEKVERELEERRRAGDFARLGEDEAQQEDEEYAVGEMNEIKKLEKQRDALLQKIRGLVQDNKALEAIGVEEQSASKKDDQISQDWSHISPKEVIQRIRVEKGVHIKDAAFLKCTNSLYRTLDSAIQKLGEDIYSSHSRFVLELIQNADDNLYDEHSDAQPPEYVIDVFLDPSTSSYIWTFNNEAGFQVQNVRAICDIGGSSKSSQKKASSASIGYKGIGFKSIFKVTHTPLILSTDYKFGFDATQPLGFITPQWISQEQFDLLESLQLLKNRDTPIQGTNMFFPLRPDLHLQTFQEEIQIIFDDLENIIIFLQKLKLIRLAVHLPNQPTMWKEVRLTKKEKIPESSMELLRVESTTSQFLETKVYDFKVAKKIFQVPQEVTVPERLSSRMNLHDKKETCILLAFPSVPRRFPVYSFLPIKEVGFEFLIHADFELTASRQDVHEKNSWNLFLRDCISDAILHAFQSSEDMTAEFIEYIPHEDFLPSLFWKKIVQRLKNSFFQMQCLRGASGNKRKPSELLIRNEQLDGLLTNQELLKALSMEFLHPDYSSIQSILQEIMGIRILTINHILEATQQIDFSLKSKIWFHLLYSRILSHFSSRSTSLSLTTLPTLDFERLVHARIFVITSSVFDGANPETQITSLNDGPLFLFDDSSKGNLVEEYGLKHVVRALDPELWKVESREDISDSVLQEFIEFIGIRRIMSQYEIALAILKKNVKLPLTEYSLEELDVVWRNLRYLKDNWDFLLNNSILKRFLNDLSVPTDDCMLSHLSKSCIRNENTLALCVNDFSLFTVTRCISECPLATSEETWEKFFINAGAHVGPQFLVEKLKIPGFLSSVSKFLAVDSRLCAFLSILDQNWNSGEEYSKVKGLPQFLQKLLNPLTLSCLIDGFVDESRTFLFTHDPFVSEFEFLGLPVFKFRLENDDLSALLHVHNSLSPKAMEDLSQFYFTNPQPSLSEEQFASIAEKVYSLAMKYNLGHVLKFFWTGNAKVCYRKSSFVFKGNEVVAKLCRKFILGNVFPNHKKLFVEEAGIPETFSYPDITSALKRFERDIVSKDSFISKLSREELLETLSNVYSSLDQLILEEYISENILNSMLIFTEEMTFKCKNSSGLFINDNLSVCNALENKAYPIHAIVASNLNLVKKLDIPYASMLLSEGKIIRNIEYVLSNSVMENFYQDSVHTIKNLFSSSFTPEEIALLDLIFEKLQLEILPVLHVEIKIPRAVHHSRTTNYQTIDIAQDFYFDKRNYCLYLSSLICDPIAFEAHYSVLRHIIGKKVSDEGLKLGISPASVVAALSEISISKLEDIRYRYSLVSHSRRVFRLSYKDSEYYGSISGVMEDASKDSESERLPEILQSISFFDYLTPERLMNMMDSLSKTSARQHSGRVASIESPIGASSLDLKPFDLSELSTPIIKRIGYLGELYFFHFIRNLLNGFLSRYPGSIPEISYLNWVSSARDEAFPNMKERTDDSLGYDFYIPDPKGCVEGMLFPKHHPGFDFRGIPTTWLIEVKGHVRQYKNQCFKISPNEWEIARRSSVVSFPPGQIPSCRYLVVGVALTPTPRIIYLLPDPHLMARQGKLLVAPTDFELLGVRTLN